MPQLPLPKIIGLPETLTPAQGITPSPVPLPADTISLSDASAASIPTNPSVANQLIATCTINSLNVRSGPGISYPVIANVSIGQKVRVLNRQEGWAKIESPAGWSSEAYLSFQQDVPVDALKLDVPVQAPSISPTPQKTGPEILGVCNTSGLNVRGGPGVTYPIIGGLTYGQRVKILAQKDGWAQVQSPSGWCNQSYLSIT